VGPIPRCFYRIAGEAPTFPQKRYVFAYLKSLPWEIELSGGMLCVSQTFPPMTDRAPTRYPAEDCRSRVDDNVILYDGMAVDSFDGVALFIQRETLGSQRDPLINAHAIPNDRRFSYHDSRAVIDKKASADFGSGVNIDARNAMRVLADNPWYHRHSQPV